MKYEADLYLSSGIYAEDEETESKTEKIVKCRKPHKCAMCQNEISKGELALLEKGFLDGKPVTCHTCLPCIEWWLEESGQVEWDDEVIE